VNITAYTDVVDDIVAAISTAIPAVVTAVGVVTAGLLALKFGVRWLRSQAR